MSAEGTSISIWNKKDLFQLPVFYRKRRGGIEDEAFVDKAVEKKKAFLSGKARKAKRR